MIGQLRGRLAEKRPNQVLVDVGGVGYVVQVPLSTFAALGELHTEVTLLIHTHVREDALSLYGLFPLAKTPFEMLLSVGRRTQLGAENFIGHERGRISAGDSRKRS
jgi:Holliday junction DNA helicase RuvA